MAQQQVIPADEPQQVCTTTTAGAFAKPNEQQQAWEQTSTVLLRHLSWRTVREQAAATTTTTTAGAAAATTSSGLSSSDSSASEMDVTGAGAGAGAGIGAAMAMKAAKRLPQPWEEALAVEMMSVLSKSPNPVALSQREIQRFATRFCYTSNLKRTASMIERVIRRSIQINGALRAAGLRFFRVLLAETRQGSMSERVVGKLVKRNAKQFGLEALIDANNKFVVTRGFSDRSLPLHGSDDEDDDDELEEDVLDVTEDIMALDI